MQTSNKDSHDELFHPLWLGIILLFVVIGVLGISCFLRRKYGSRICQLFYRSCCQKEYNLELHSKSNKYLSTRKPYHWAPVYVPSSSLSPKLYTLTRNMRMASQEQESSLERANSDEYSFDPDVSSIPEESNHSVKTPDLPTDEVLSNNRNCETARKFYASMKQTSICPNSISMDSPTTKPSHLTNSARSTKFNRIDKLKFFHTSHFFQSITRTH